MWGQTGQAFNVCLFMFLFLDSVHSRNSLEMSSFDKSKVRECVYFTFKSLNLYQNSRWRLINAPVFFSFVLETYLYISQGLISSSLLIMIFKGFIKKYDTYKNVSSSELFFFFLYCVHTSASLSRKRKNPKFPFFSQISSTLLASTFLTSSKNSMEVTFTTGKGKEKEAEATTSASVSIDEDHIVSLSLYFHMFFPL